MFWKVVKVGLPVIAVLVIILSVVSADVKTVGNSAPVQQESKFKF